MTTSYETPTRQYSGNSLHSSPYQTMETHHIIKFKPAPQTITPDQPKHNTRKDARLAMKKRLGEAGKSFTRTNSKTKEFDHYTVVEKPPIQKTTKSKLKNGGEAYDRGRERSSSVGRGIVRRTQSFKRSLSRGRRRPSSGDSVCSAKSTKSTRSLRSVGSSVLKKVRSFKKSDSFRFRKGRKNKNVRGERVVFVKQSYSPPLSVKPKRRKMAPSAEKNNGFLGFLCESFDTFNLCGGQADEEELIGRVIGVEGSEVSTEDPYDPRE
uniref:Uncharacterized protein n=1 Tax=Chaetoceros debilis TaxID=122233 RepID=A0A6S8QXX7_9STRA|mmetsp:Transcript_29452/g.44954  ORF Transcript_29452/g.44954 Transcript_29452/m.44954 type:complete len:266 (+) Transcript_29452:145-942(+)|eukprot:CAMPEP_0194087578 /NCGR_PEP_ID=MMETSP0149-20130528/25658_1 /TAXON_ID=122233 /ORGANISM="Chaetoceros debilis, Strain MM31A-1" /LENGTH=265 /DNA_ID=CAMNT_0038770971 /DNA_START=91 /DNA_END=888 /DNA_ORIENTATION=+